MLPLHIALYTVLSTALAFAAVELGLCAFIAWAYSGYIEEDYYSYALGEYVTDTVKVHPPAIIDFMLFAGSWTIIVSAVALLLPWFYARRGAVSAKLNRTVGIILAVVYFVTMVFWLAAFADLANVTLGYYVNAYFDAMLAFAVLLWITFIGLFILSILALCGVLYSDWAGYQSLRQPRDDKDVVPGYGMPMHENPAPPPQFSSHYDAPQLQAGGQHNVSHSALNSALEYSGASAHNLQASHA
ncbi:hypothetical protein N7495_007362 [Penicillium taxi]|uniref:uncharacterized protein n=1 Tax=Penicillium taxi TaxID=168475 RepID=UPI00254531C8|nr:uncharacterized protein N7495_007362 [Penicillium taxi]KAJ5895671.1 hypothetical protein N7495_007362 [Penicillium taxi]